MSATTSIEWTQNEDGSPGRTWNPTRGCSRVSPGCENCYAEKIAARFSDARMPFHGFAERGPHGARWTRRLGLVGDALDAPVRWRKPTRVFVNSMSDLFHESLSDRDIDAVFGVMWACEYIGRGQNVREGHTFQILTKRAERMRDYMNAPRKELAVRWARAAASVGVLGENPEACHDQIAFATHVHPRIWLGVSVESQRYADERIPHLLETPAAVRFLSCEPLLGDLTLQLPRTWGRRSDGRWGCSACCHGDGCDDPTHVVRERCHACKGTGAVDSIDWVIVGGESGHGARRFDVAWARSIVEQCRAASVAVFCKQLGANVVDRNDAGFEADMEVDAETGEPTEPRAWPSHLIAEDRIEDNPNGYREEYQGAPVRIRLRSKKGGDPSEWPSDLRVRQFPEVR